jgi:replicative DNA helicase
MERAVLSAIIFDPQIFEEIASKLESHDFYLPFHQYLFIAMEDLTREDKPIDEEFLKSKLISSGNYNEVALLDVLASNPISNTDAYLRDIKSRSSKRALATLATTIKKVTMEDDLPVEEVMNLVEKKLYEITQNSTSEDFREAKEITLAMLEEMNRLKALGNSKLLGTDTGFRNLNDRTSGFGKGDLIIIAARPAMGKCVGKGTKVLMYSGELKKVENIEVGELLMGNDSTPRKVLSLARGREEMYWVRQNKGVDYRVNKSHILSLKRSRNEGKHKHGDILNIEVSDYIKKSNRFKSNYKGYKAKLDSSKLNFDTSLFSFSSEMQYSEISVEYDKVDDYYGFEIDGNRLFLLEDMTVTHNTSLVLNMTQKAIERNEGVAFFSLEMPAEQLMLRMLSTETSIPLQKLRVGDLTDEEWSRLSGATDRMATRKLFVDDGGYATIHQVRSKLRKLKNQHPEISMAIIDYLQLMSGDNKEGRQMVISEISRGLKQLARELQIPIIALSQLNRGVESRDNKRPMLSDLRESGCLSGDSIIVDAKSGRNYTIEELVNDKSLLPMETKAMDKNLKVKSFNITNAFFSGEKVTYKLTTKSGKTIRATANHKFYKVDGWTRLDKLEVGDKIATPNKENIYWEEITSIEKYKKEKTYDLTVDSVHNFVANDIIVHNSIEQDADIVMFVYRDDVYREAAEKEKEMKAKAEGREYENKFENKPEEEAELIIGKQRNGPTGTVKLIFQKRFTRFVDSSFEVVYEDESMDTSTQAHISSGGDMPII